MSAVLTAGAPAPGPAAPPPTSAPAGLGGLLRAEVQRLVARRLVRALFALAVVGLLVAVGIASTQFARSSPEVLAEAQREMDRVLAEQSAFREQCLSQPRPPDLPAEVSEEELCGPPPTPENVGGIEQFLQRTPFDLQGAGPGGAVGVAAATSAMAFLLGATAIGAEWSTRSVVALLFWEPRRWRVMAVKVGVVAVAAALLAVLAQALWAVAAPVLAATRGSTAVEPGFWSDHAGTAGRGVLLAVLAALLGFGVANLVRNTAAALGAGFVYTAFVENAVRVFANSWSPYLLTDNAVALVMHGGHRVYVNEGYVDETGAYEVGREVLLSNLHGAAVLGVVTVLVVGLGALLFARRDLD